MNVIETIKLIAPEFTNSEADIAQWVEIVKPHISEKQFGKLYTQALAYLTAHYMKMSGLGDNTLGTVADSMRVGSVSEGNTSVSYNSGAASGGQDADSELALTPYGLQYKRIRQQCVIPVTGSGMI